MLKHILTGNLIQICFFCTNVYAGGGGEFSPVQKIIVEAPQNGGGDGVALVASIIGGIAVVLAAVIPVLLKKNKD